MSGKGLFPMRRHHNKEYNIFALPDEKFEGRVFDRNRRVDYKTYPLQTTDKAIMACKAIAELVAKGQCIPESMAIHVDEGKPIRDKEDKNYLNFKKEVRKQNRIKKGTL